LKQLSDGHLRESAQQIDRAAQRAGEFTHQLLAFSRQQVLRPEVIDLNTVVAETLTMLERSFGGNIQIRSQLEPALEPVLVDRGQIAQAVLNLAINARDAMSEAGGTLSIRTANIELDEAYADTHEAVPAGSYVVLQMTDSGTGMDKDTQSRAFDPFFTTKEEGTGLGLATVYGLVKQSGGHIWLYSEPGMGTTFKLYFPTTSAEFTLRGESSNPTSLNGNEMILLVEDTEMVRALVTATLKSYGYTVLVAASGPEAIEIADQAHARIDLLMTDVVMPKMTGRELADRLVATRPGLKVLFTSGYPSDTVLRHGIAEARTAFIEKPYLPEDLAHKVREILDQRPAA
jgi:two-component system cell cycle sensor histidine kinase/response regulator CckA